MQEIINNTIDILESGGTIIYPTDTIWGIGCDATNHKAVSKVYDIKARDTGKSMLILVSSVDMLKNYVEDIPDIAYDLLNISDSPLTIIYPKAKNLPSNLYANDGSIGIRISKNDFCLKLIQAFDKPIVSTSANLAGDKSPLGFFDISEKIKQKADYIVPLNQDCFSPKKSSDIIKINSKGEIEVIR